MSAIWKLGINDAVHAAIREHHADRVEVVEHAAKAADAAVRMMTEDAARKLWLKEQQEKHA